MKQPDFNGCPELEKAVRDAALRINETLAKACNLRGPVQVDATDLALVMLAFASVGQAQSICQEALRDYDEMVEILQAAIAKAGSNCETCGDVGKVAIEDEPPEVIVATMPCPDCTETFHCGCPPRTIQPAPG